RDEALHFAEMLCGIKCSECNSLLPKDVEVCKACGATKFELHKQVANRILEPFDHITVVLSTTKLKNHFKLRTELFQHCGQGKEGAFCHHYFPVSMCACDCVDCKMAGRPKADPTYYELATKWEACFKASTPRLLKAGEWHLPYVSKMELGGDMSKDDFEAILGYSQMTKDNTPDTERAAEGIIKVAKMISTGRCARVSYMRQGQGDVAENVKLHDGLAK